MKNKISHKYKPIHFKSIGKIFALLIFSMILSGASFPETTHPLESVLTHISERTGIEFQIMDDSLGDQSVPFLFNDFFPEQAVQRFLEQFNRVAINNEIQGIRKIIILGFKSDTFDDFHSISQIQLRRKKPLHPSGVWLKSHQLKALAQGPFRSPIPSYLYYDAPVKEFLALYGINSPEDMEDISKVIRIRVESRRQLKLQLSESSRTVIPSHQD